ncbi:KS1 protein-like isoform X9 [Vigna unguiculata]|uniref:KS1 protein-like isoform X9 n=1 Tax=Vigna unguiculata TaxID=3917 RepID=UPI0010168170|nr:KS1 protein-like isoform X9 [Vigna unguiculata]
MNEATIFHILHSLSVTNKRMLRLRRKSVEKRNSRGDIVRKEEVVTLTKKFHASNKAQEKIPDWKPTTTGRPYEFLPPYQGVLLSNPHRQFPPQGVLLSNLPRQFPPQGYLFSELPQRQQGGFSKTNAKNFEAKVSNAEDSDAEDVEGSDAEDTNSEECEVDDTNSEKSEDDDTNSEESQDENSNYEESETEEINSEESEAEDINSEESEAEDINSEEYETEDINSEESEAEDINSEESSEEYEDSDNEPPRHLMDLKPAERRNLSTGRHHFTIDRMSNRSMMGRNFWFQE